jgi:omega-amidase
MHDKIKTAVIQMSCEPGNIDANLEKGIDFIRKSKDNNADLAVLPELFNVGYDLEMVRNLDYDNQYTLDKLKSTAESESIHICAGILEIERGIKYNSIYVFNDKGEIAARYRKMNLFPLSKEYEIFEPGDEIETFRINGLVAGLMICFDLRFPELSRQYIAKKCSMLVVSSAFPFPRLDHWRILLKARAIENQMYIAASNRVGKDGGLWFCGNSSVIDPWGVVVSTANETDEGIIYGEIIKEKVMSVRNTIPCFRNPI